MPSSPWLKRTTGNGPRAGVAPARTAAPGIPAAGYQIVTWSVRPWVAAAGWPGVGLVSREGSENVTDRSPTAYVAGAGAAVGPGWGVAIHGAEHPADRATTRTSSSAGEEGIGERVISFGKFA